MNRLQLGVAMKWSVARALHPGVTQRNPWKHTLTLLLILTTSSAAQAADVDFNRDVRPILAARCFKCHGPDETARKAKLRLDTREGAERVLGKPAESELVRRILSADEA